MATMCVGQKLCHHVIPSDDCQRPGITERISNNFSTIIMPRRLRNIDASLGDADTFSSDDLDTTELANDKRRSTRHTLSRGSPRSVSFPKTQQTARKHTSRISRRQERPSTSSAPRRRKQLTPQQKNVRLLGSIRKLMASTDFLIPRACFGRLLREILMDTSRGTDVTRITKVALQALQESSEMYLVQQFQDAYTLTLFRGRVTLQVKDMEVLRYLRGHV